jgi:asparagine synthase (glutamine-hydrolysing)
MQSIFGLMYRDGRPIDPAVPAAMSAALMTRHSRGPRVWQHGSVALGQDSLRDMAGGPGHEGPFHDPVSGLVAVWSGRLDNRADLCETLGISHELHRSLHEAGLVLAGYQRWGGELARRVYGDWAFAVWDPREGKLFVARDHHGNTALYFHADASVFAFASSKKALFALELAPREFDEMRLAQLLLALPPDPAERTLDKSIQCVPPAHTLAVTRERLQLTRYWFPEQLPELLLSRREDYADALREVFDEAVRCRLPGNQKIGVTLSGGLDSGAVAVTAAGFLRQAGKCLHAYTSVPLSDTTSFVDEEAYGNEFPFAQETARQAGNIELTPVGAQAPGILGSIREVLRAFDEPLHAACNLYWIWSLLQTARAAGCGTVLTGQFGNAGISRAGHVTSLPWSTRRRLLGWRGFAKTLVEPFVPAAALFGFRLSRHSRQYGPWHRQSAIHPAFARRLGIYNPRTFCWDLQPRPAREELFLALRPGRSNMGALWAEWARAAALEIWDPTADVRVLEFTLRVPDRIFFDPVTNTGRWLIRQAMSGRLPDKVRLGHGRGKQAADLVPRLRAEAEEIEKALQELARGPAAEYVDLPHLHEVWQRTRTQNTPAAVHWAAAVLTKGIMVGLFVNEYRKQGSKP